MSLIYYMSGGMPRCALNTIVNITPPLLTWITNNHMTHTLYFGRQSAELRLWDEVAAELGELAAWVLLRQWRAALLLPQISQRQSASPATLLQVSHRQRINKEVASLKGTVAWDGFFAHSNPSGLVIKGLKYFWSGSTNNGIMTKIMSLCVLGKCAKWR